MSIARSTPDDATIDALVADYLGRPQPSEEQIDAWAEEDGGALTDADLGKMHWVFPAPTAVQVRAARERMALTQAEFALRFGFDVETLKDYESGRVMPSGPAATLLRVLAADPAAVERAITQPIPA